MTVVITEILCDSGDHRNIVWWQWRSLKHCMMIVETTEILYNDSGDHWILYDSGDHWNTVWWQWRSLKHWMTTEVTDILYDDSRDHLNAVIFYSLRHWNNVWWHWRSLKCCILIMEITEMLFADNGRCWHAVWWVEVITFWLWFVPVLK